MDHPTGCELCKLEWQVDFFLCMEFTASANDGCLISSRHGGVLNPFLGHFVKLAMGFVAT